MTEQGKPVLLTEREWERLLVSHTESVAERVEILRERGLIAPEPPVDPLLVEARKQADMWWPGEGALTGNMDDSMWMDRILAALRRGMELRPELTRERVRDALLAVWDAPAWANAFAPRVHAALTDGGRDG